MRGRSASPATWLEPISAVIARHGLPTVFAASLLGVALYLGAFRLPDLFGAYLEAQGARAAALETKLDAHEAARTARDAEARDYERASLQLQLLTCINTARSAEAEKLCEAVRR
jgi:hypothetical protein